MKSKPSQRFEPSALAARLVPVILVLIVIGLAAVIVVTAMALMGLTPGA